MIEALLGLIIAGVLIFLILKAIGNIIKGAIFLFLAFLIYLFLSNSFQSLSPTLQPIGSFLKAPVEKVKNFLYKVEIVAIKHSQDSLTIVVRNSGIMPLSNFSVKIDDKEARILNKISFLLPRQIGAMEVEWEGRYSKVEVLTNEGISALFLPSEPAS